MKWFCILFLFGWSSVSTNSYAHLVEAYSSSTYSSVEKPCPIKKKKKKRKKKRLLKRKRAYQKVTEKNTTRVFSSPVTKEDQITWAEIIIITLIAALVVGVPFLIGSLIGGIGWYIVGSILMGLAYLIGGVFYLAGYSLEYIAFFIFTFLFFINLGLLIGALVNGIPLLLLFTSILGGIALIGVILYFVFFYYNLEFIFKKKKE